MRKTLTTLTIVLALGAAACGSKSEVAGAPEQLDGITVETVALKPVEGFTESLGVVKARTVSNIAAKLMATVVATPVSEGDQVKAGQLVLQLDDRDVAAQLRKAQSGLQEIENAIVAAEAGRTAATAQADFATATYNRYVALRERKSVSPQEFDQVEANYKGAVAQKEQAERMVDSMYAKREQVKADISAASAMLSWARITAPTDGIVTARRIDVGSQAAPGMPLLTIEDPSSFRVETTLGEDSLGDIHARTSVKVVLDASGVELEGTVAHVSPALDAASRSFTVKVDLPKTDALTTGLTARVRFPMGETEAISVPVDAIVTRGQLTGIWTADPEGIARLRFLRTGRTIGDRIEVLSGLSDGDRIVAVKNPSLREGAKIADATPEHGSES